MRSILLVLAMINLCSCDDGVIRDDFKATKAIEKLFGEQDIGGGWLYTEHYIQSRGSISIIISIPRHIDPGIELLAEIACPSKFEKEFWESVKDYTIYMQFYPRDGGKDVGTICRSPI